MDFSDQGFLGKFALEFESDFKNKHKPLFDVLAKFNNLSHEIRFQIKIDSTDSKSIVICNLYWRAVEHFEAIVLLRSRGMGLDANVILRSFFETLVTLKNLTKSEKYWEQYIAQAYYSKVKSLNKMKSIPKKSKFRKNFNLKEIETALEAERKRYSLAKEPPEAPSVQELARIADLHEYYLATYSYLSWHSHGELLSLNKYNGAGDGGYIESLNYGPNLSNFTEVIPLAMDFLTQSIGIFALHFSLDNDISNKLARLIHEFVRAYSEVVKK